MIARFAFRVLACVCWWGAACLASLAWRDQHEIGSVLAWASAALLLAVGAALWKGSEE